MAQRGPLAGETTSYTYLDRAVILQILDIDDTGRQGTSLQVELRFPEGAIRMRLLTFVKQVSGD